MNAPFNFSSGVSGEIVEPLFWLGVVRIGGRRKGRKSVSNQIAAQPKSERMRFYSRMAFETSKLAEAAVVPEARETFLRLAHCWNALASDLAEEEEAVPETAFSIAAE